VILFANFLSAFASFIHVILTIYVWIIIIRSVLSWIKIPGLYQVAVIIYYLTEPVLRPFRRFIPPYKLGGIDITPIIVILLILFVDRFLVESLSDYAQQLREHALSF